MPYTLPTVDQLRERFNEKFDDVDDFLIESAIDEAAGCVDTTWQEDDYQPAIMFLAAHNLIEEDALGDRDTGVSGPIVSEKLGDASANYANPQNNESNSVYGSTVYGRRFARLQKRNFSGATLL